MKHDSMNESMNICCYHNIKLRKLIFSSLNVKFNGKKQNSITKLLVSLRAKEYLLAFLDYISFMC